MGAAYAKIAVLRFDPGSAGGAPTSIPWRRRNPHAERVEGIHERRPMLITPNWVEIAATDKEVYVA